MTKAYLERQRAELKSAIGKMYQLATAPRRMTQPTEKDLRALLREIESIAFVAMAIGDDRLCTPRHRSAS